MDVNLILFKKNGSQKVFPLPKDTTIIGRRHNCDLCIPLESVSKRHCQLNYNKKELKILDLGSRNGTKLNGKRIDEAAIQPGDAIEIGPLKFVLQINGHPQTLNPPPTFKKPSQQEIEAAEKTDIQFASFKDLDNSDSSEESSNSSGDNDPDLLPDNFDSLEDDI